MNVWKPVELLASTAAKVAWSGFQGANRRFKSQTFQPAWAPAPLLKSHERTRPQLGWPRTTDSLCPVCVRETRARILSGEQSLESLVGGHTAEIPAHILERDGKVIIEKTCPVHGTFTDTMAINPAFLQRMESLFPGRDFPAVTDTLHNHGTSSIQPWPRLGAHDRSDQPLQHDVRSVLHGCEPGRLRARVDARRSEEAARRRGQREAAAADDGAVLRRRADDLADLSRRGPLRGRGGLLQRPGRDQRHPIRAGRRLRARGARGRTSNRLPAVRRRHRSRRTPIGKSGTCSK